MAKLLKIGDSVSEISGVEIGTKEEIKAGIAEAKPVTVSENEIGGLGVKTAKSIVVGEDVFNIPSGSSVSVGTEEPEEGTPEAKSITVDDVTYKLGGGSSEPVHIHWESDEGVWATVNIAITLEELEAIKGKPCRIFMEFNNAGVVQNCTNLMTLSTNTAHYSVIFCPAYGDILEWAHVYWSSTEEAAAIHINEPDSGLGEDCLIKKIDIYSM